MGLTLKDVPKPWLLSLSILLLSLRSLASSPTLEATQSQLEIDGRQLQVWSWVSHDQPKGVVLFSHGALSAPWKYERLIQYWALAGYNVHAPLHVDSEDHPHRDNYQGLASWKTRLEDMRMLADAFGGEGYIAAGHSYGALVSLATGGVEATIPEGITPPLLDRRVRLVLAFSPPPAIPGFVEKTGYAGLSVPALIQTGTKDIPPGGSRGWQGHLDAYEMAPSNGDRYALILEGVDHYFGGAICRPELPGPMQLEPLRIAAELSTLMIAAHVENNETALQQLQQQLQENGPTTFQTK